MKVIAILNNYFNYILFGDDSSNTHVICSQIKLVNSEQNTLLHLDRIVFSKFTTFLPPINISSYIFMRSTIYSCNISFQINYASQVMAYPQTIENNGTGIPITLPSLLLEPDLTCPLFYWLKVKNTTKLIMEM